MFSFLLKNECSTSRVRDIGRHYPSGSSKRKATKDKLEKTQLAISTSRKMTENCTKQRDIGDISRSESEKYTATTEADVETVQQGKGTVEEGDTGMHVPLFSFFRMTLSPCYMAEKIKRD